MQVLLEQSKIDNVKLKKLLSKFTATELGKLSEPCYYPEIKKNYYEILHVCGLTEQDLKEFVKRFYKDSPASKWLLTSDPTTNLHVFLMYYFLLNKDVQMFSIDMTYHMIRQYSNVMHKMFTFCNPDVFRYALEHIAKTHLFSREKTIPNSLYFLAKELGKRHEKSIAKADRDGIIRFIMESRHRISQSMKSFAELYYKASEEGAGVKTPKEDEQGNEYQVQSLEKGQRVIEDIVKSITVYKTFDKVAMIDATKLTKVNKKLSEELARELMNTKYSDNIKIILDLFVKDLANVKAICGKEFFSYVKKSMAVKRTNKKIYFKQQVNVLTVKLIEDINYEDKYNSLSSQSQFLINLYVALYITLILRHHLCGTKSVNVASIKSIWGW